MKKFLRLLAGLWLLAVCGVADAASLLPNGKQQFVDGNGKPFAGGTVQFYIPNTTTPKSTWQDQNQTILNTNPVVLDGDGRAVIYGEGIYRQVVRDSLGNLIWDQLTADPAVANSSWGGTSTGTANNQIVPTGNFTAQDGQTYAFRAGFTNTAGVSLTVDRVGSFQVRKDTQSGPVALGANDFTAGNIVNLVYDAGLGVFHMVSFPPGDAFSISTLTVSGQTTIAGPLAISSTITPTILTTDTNNWTPTGIVNATRIFATASTSVILTGIGGTHVNGQILYVFNTGSNLITFVNENTNSTDINRFTLPASIPLQPGQSLQLTYDSTSTRWKVKQYVSPQGIGGTSRNLAITVTSNTVTTLTADLLLLNAANGNTVRRVQPSISCDIATTGAGGLDTGSEAASTWYAVYSIYNPITNVDNCLLSLSATTPTLPSGFTFANRFGWIRNNASSNLLRTLQRGDVATYIVGTNPTTALIVGSGIAGNPNTSTWSSLNITTFVPSTAREIRGAVSTTSDSSTVIAAPNSSYGSQSSTTNAPPVVLNTAVDVSTTVPFEFVLEGSTISWASADSGNRLYVNGWTDTLN